MVEIPLNRQEVLIQSNLSPLRVGRIDNKPQIVTKEGIPFYPKGIAVSGLFHQENFLLQYPGTESTMSMVMKDVLGENRANAFYDTLFRNLLAQKDIAYIAHTLGANSIRLPINYRRFMTDDGVYNEAVFEKLKDIIDRFGKEGVYTLVDLHAMPGGQNEDWHSDNATGEARLWTDRKSQQQAVAFVGKLGMELAGNTNVLGVELLNEPNAPSVEVLNGVYQDLANAYRKHADHILFLDGNKFASEAKGVSIKDNNWVLAAHIYNKALIDNNEDYPGLGTDGIYRDSEHYRREVRRQDVWQTAEASQVPASVTEFGLAIKGKNSRRSSRIRGAGDMMTLFNEVQLPWFLWIYKGFIMGLVEIDPKSAYSRLTQPQNEKDVLGESVRQRQIAFAKRFDLPEKEIVKIIEDSFALENCIVDPRFLKAFQRNTTNH